jgi:hypothetical protein
MIHRCSPPWLIVSGKAKSPTMRRSQAPVAFHNLLAQCPAPQFDRGAEDRSSQEGVAGRLFLPRPPTQHRDLIAYLNLTQQAG